MEEKKALKDKEDVDAEISETPVEKARKRSRTDAFEADVDADNIDDDTEAGPSASDGREVVAPTLFVDWYQYLR